MDSNIDDCDVSPASIIQKNLSFTGSEIMGNQDSKFITDWLNTIFTSGFKFELIYRASRDGDRTFHEFCDNKGPTLSIIRSENDQIFGGFSKNSWNCSGDFGDDDNDAFLYSLSTQTIYKCKVPMYATYNVNETYIMSYGYPDGIILFTDFLKSNSNTAYVEGNSFGSDDNCKTRINLSGTEKFKVLDCEFYKVNLE